MTKSVFQNILLLLTCILFAQCIETGELDRIIDNAPEAIQLVAANPEKYEVQILYVQIDRDSRNIPTFKEFGYNVDGSRYFYPASTVKMPMAFLALDKMNSIGRPGLNRDTRMQIDSSRYPQSAVLIDSTSKTGMPSIGHYIKKVFIVSDNDGYNRLYEFVGQEEAHERLSDMGLNQTRIIHRLSDFRFGPSENRYTNPMLFFNKDTLVYAQPEKHAGQVTRSDLSGQHKGVAYIDTSGKKVTEPFDFTSKNFFPLHDQVEALKKVLFPEVFDKTQRFNLTEDDYTFLYKAMSTLPRESKYPKYQGDEYVDSYVKFLMYGDNRDTIPSHIRIFNKVGWAYGYLTDCAYVVDFKNNIEFILAATIHVNENRTYNDGIYEFDETGIPFLAELGRQVYKYEIERPRRHESNLEKFSLSYNNK